MARLVDNVCMTSLTPLFTRSKMGFELDIRLVNEMFDTFPATDDANVRVRTKVFDEFVKDYLKEKPNAIIGNFGCGFCTRFWRVDNGEMKWVNYDLMPIIQLREKHFPKSDRVRNFKCNFKVEKFNLEFDLIIAEGFFQYLDKSKITSHISSPVIFDLTEKSGSKFFMWPYTGDDIPGLKILRKEKFGASGRPLWFIHAEPEKHDFSS